jgi:hypothetical protein
LFFFFGVWLVCLFGGYFEDTPSFLFSILWLTRWLAGGAIRILENTMGCCTYLGGYFDSNSWDLWILVLHLAMAFGCGNLWGFVFRCT